MVSYVTPFGTNRRFPHLRFCEVSTVREITDALSAPSRCPLARGARGHRTVISRTVLSSHLETLSLYFFQRRDAAPIPAPAETGHPVLTCFNEGVHFRQPVRFCKKQRTLQKKSELISGSENGRFLQNPAVATGPGIGLTGRHGRRCATTWLAGRMTTSTGQS